LISLGKQELQKPKRAIDMKTAVLTRRRLLQNAALASVALPMPFVRAARAATVVPKGKMTLAWHTNIASAGSTRSSTTARRPRTIS